MFEFNPFFDFSFQLMEDTIFGDGSMSNQDCLSESDMIIGQIDPQNEQKTRNEMNEYFRDYKGMNEKKNENKLIDLNENKDQEVEIQIPKSDPPSPSPKEKTVQSNLELSQLKEIKSNNNKNENAIENPPEKNSGIKNLFGNFYLSNSTFADSISLIPEKIEEIFGLKKFSDILENEILLDKLNITMNLGMKWLVKFTQKNETSEIEEELPGNDKLGKKRKRRATKKEMEERKKNNANKEKKKCGRKKKGENTELGNPHNKYSFDNIILGIKSNLLGYILKLINELLEEGDNKFKTKKRIKKLDFQENAKKISKEFNERLYDKTIAQIFSENISPKFENDEETHNKELIDKIIDDNTNQKLISVLNLTYHDFLDIFRYKESEKIQKELGKEVLDKFHRIDYYLKIIYDKEKTTQKNKDEIINYLRRILIITYNYERWFLSKNGRKEGEKRKAKRELKEKAKMEKKLAKIEKRKNKK